eukprot:GILJ01003609.1.p1 GENE.GILJ01003609.1~~GILJ01003609.1.p1  ORF type:complete len:518 (+),score=70.65 GILJ01003609.1:79-1632(+)
MMMQSETNTQLAPEVSTKLNLPAENITQVGPGVVDYVLKCTAGLFKGRFIFVNKTVDGEIFGSDPDQHDLSMYIENAGLSGRHAEIKYINDQYILRDSGSETGTFVRVRSDIPKEVQVGQVYRFGTTDLTVKPDAEIADRISFESKEGQTYEIGRQGGEIGRKPGCVVHLEDHKVEPVQAKLFFDKGSYHIIDLVEDSAGAMRRLLPGDSYVLRPGDIFRIGDLEFTIYRFNMGVCAEQGVRGTMEDMDVTIQELGVSESLMSSFFGVYDGHGGSDCARFLAVELHKHFINAFKEKGGLDSTQNFRQDVRDAMRKAFLDADQKFLTTSSEDAMASGCAAVVVSIIGDRLYAANAGDARAVLCRGGKAIDLSLDHKPDRPDEMKRIEEAGGFVSFRRVLGRLAVSRAFGDFEYKMKNSPLLKMMTKEPNALVIADPEIREETLTAEDEFVLIACDGLFDVFSSQDAVDFIRHRLASMPVCEQDPQRVVKEIVNEAIHTRRSRDNVSAIIVTLNRGIQL